MTQNKAKSPQKGVKSGAPDSMGYPALEKLLEAVHPDLSGFKMRSEELKKLAKTAQKADSQKAARQAELAYQRFFELFEELLKIRENIAKEKLETAQNTPKTK